MCCYRWTDTQTYSDNISLTRSREKRAERTLKKKKSKWSNPLFCHALVSFGSLLPQILILFQENILKMLSSDQAWKLMQKTSFIQLDSQLMLPVDQLRQLCETDG